MTGILITFNLAAMILLSWVFGRGFFIAESPEISMHIRLALLATALCVFAHCMTMMYVVAVGRMIREAVEKGGLEAGYIAQTKKYRKQIFRAAGLSMVVVMLNTILAGGAHTKLFPMWVHTLLSLSALALNAWAVILEVRYLIINHLLGHRVAREFEKQR